MTEFGLVYYLTVEHEMGWYAVKPTNQPIFRLNILLMT